MLNILSDSEIEYPVTSCIGEFIVNNSRKSIVFIGGIHGNEPTGYLALQKVVAKLTAKKDKLQGNFFALTGNIKALNLNQRFIDQDLNRIWKQENFDKLESGEVTLDNATNEWAEFIRLHDKLKRVMALNQELVVIDLHTTSSPSKPFITLADNEKNRNYSRKFPVPIVLGIDQYLKGPLLSYMSDQGYVSMAFEAGQHEDPTSVDKHEAFIWLALVNSGILNIEDVENFQDHVKTLATKNSLKSRFFTVQYRLDVKNGDGFKMVPGYKNFKKVRKAEVLATSNNGSILAPFKGRIFMPLYQKTGEDGFFIVRKIKLKK